MRYILDWTALLLFHGLAAAVLGILAFRAARWCLRRRGWIPRIAVLAVLAVLSLGIIYGLLRLAGLVKIPGDNTYSPNFFNASWRDEGAALLQACCGPFAGISFALILRRRHTD